ncbi:flavin-dependent oxidoreductase [Allokutzneria albata]|uniref:2-polyprenyl-6-methoxyphenol hydroxylase n=1 Tax=Allokutzneria albata TaxID=211114 RepID=A0A1G9Y8L3_ALLAB|nr:flavin-dependent oxidoreductase [Allokutzneria albata]SDN04753.1 2-polyprenyl-6-methoxyphenol hydroxylase [Allokutzneria albata]
MPRVLVVGAGVGGLTAALALHRSGLNVRVVEAASCVAPIGVGLNILPNAVRELAALGLLDKLAESAVATKQLAFYNRYGDLIWQEPRGLDAGYRWPQFSIHRGDLVRVLLDAVRARLGADAVITGARLASHTDGPNGPVVARLAHPDGRRTTLEADVLVGADGIHSTVRAALYPDEGPPPWNGLVMWRGTTWGQPFLTGSSMIVTGDDVRRVVLYPVRRDPASGRVLINWVAAAPSTTVPDAAPSPRKRVPVSAAMAEFGDWRFPWLDIGGVLAATKEVFEYPMLDRDPLSRWSVGRTTLLGDAAHPMYPAGSNGATQAVVDACALADALSQHSPATAALAEYERIRRPVTTEIQTSNRRMGPEVVITMAHQRAPNGFTDIDEVISPAELAGISARYASTGRFDIDTVNSKGCAS